MRRTEEWRTFASPQQRSPWSARAVSVSSRGQLLAGSACSAKCAIAAAKQESVPAQLSTNTPFLPAWRKAARPVGPCRLRATAISESKSSSLGCLSCCCCVPAGYVWEGTRTGTGAGVRKPAWWSWAEDQSCRMGTGCGCWWSNTREQYGQSANLGGPGPSGKASVVTKDGLFRRNLVNEREVSLAQEWGCFHRFCAASSCQSMYLDTYEAKVEVATSDNSAALAGQLCDWRGRSPGKERLARVMGTAQCV